MSITARCRKDFYPAYHDSGKRALTDISLIVLHSTEGGSASSVAHYFHTPSAGGSTHLVIDDHGCQRCLADDRIPWGAPGANQQGWHVEQCGYAAWTHDQWMQHLPMLHRVAYKISRASHRYHIPLDYLTATDLEHGKRGVTSHHAVSRWQTAIRAPGDHSHTDPGSGYPITMVLDLAKHYKAQMK